MNDFTKEELQELVGCTFHIDKNYKQEFMDNLRIKILSMIENYCDHPNPYILMECAQNSGIHYCHDCKTMWKV